MATDPICGMKVSEKSAIKLEWKKKAYYFCSESCRKKFIKENKIKAAPKTCASCGPSKPSLLKNRVLWMFAVYALVFSLPELFPVLRPLRMNLSMYIQAVGVAVIIGLLIGGIIDWLVPREYVSVLLAGKKKRTIIYSVITGFLMSACSHGILALAIQLYKKGASTPAVIAFLLASPWANFPLTIMMFAFFGWRAFVIVGSAVIIAIISGYIFMGLEAASLVEHNPNTVRVARGFSIIKDIKKRARQIKPGLGQTLAALRAIFNGVASLSNMVLWWIMLGMLLASLAAAYLPQNFMANYMGPTILGLLVTLALATIIEVCSEGTAPMAFEIFRQTGALGNSFVFLMAGVVTDYTEIGLLWTNIGMKTALWLPVVAVPQVIAAGILFNLLIR